MSAYLLLCAGLAAMVVCGNVLVTGSVQLARFFKISTLVVGLTIVGFGTSAPELFISVQAALSGSPDIALGNVIGSNVANIGLILAFVALIIPITVRAGEVGFDLLVVFGVTILLLAFGFNGVIGRAEAACLLLIMIAYVLFSIKKSKKKVAAAAVVEKPTIKPLVAVLMIVAAIAGLYFGSGWFVNGARELALMWGVSERVVGISVVAVGTSMPELVVSLIAIFKKEADLSVGNIVGSNFFNIAGVLGVTAAVSPIAIGSRTLFLTDMAWLFGISIVLCLTMLPLSRSKITRREGCLMLLIFAAYMFTLYR